MPLWRHLSLETISARGYLYCGSGRLGRLAALFPALHPFTSYFFMVRSSQQPPGRGQITKIVLKQSTTRIANRLACQPNANHYGLAGVFKNRLQAYVFDIQY